MGHGAQDLAIDPDVARWYSAALPSGELAVIDGAGHAANLTHADAVNWVVKAVLANAVTRPGVHHAMLVCGPSGRLPTASPIVWLGLRDCLGEPARFR